MAGSEVQVRAVDRDVPGAGALTGAMISGGFGLAWTHWGASGVPGPASVVIRVIGSVVGLVIVVWAARLRRSAPPEGGGSFLSSSAYRLIVGLEVVGLIGGALVLGAADRSEYVSAWFAAVVGIHFLAFGRVFDPRFYWLGAALIAAGVAGAAVGLAGGGLAGIAATSCLTAAASLYGAGGVTVLRARQSPTEDQE